MMGEGGYCTAWRARWEGHGEVCARVVDSPKSSTAVSEVATVTGLPDIAIKVHGFSRVWYEEKQSDFCEYEGYRICVISELCEVRPQFSALSVIFSFPCSFRHLTQVLGTSHSPVHR